MATGGEVPGQCAGSSGSEDLDQMICQPCLEDGHHRQAVGMCVDCQDCLCMKCFEIHTQPRPSRNHQLLNREQMLQDHIKPTPKDICTERCPVHQEEMIQYYCLDHYTLGCPVCITADHNTCPGVQYIPQVTKELASNREYKQVEKELRSALEAFKKASENATQNADQLDASCTTALESVRKYRKRVEEAFDKIETMLIQKAQEIKAKEVQELQAVNEKYTKLYEELHKSLATIEAFQSAKQNCSSYTEMMKTKEKLKSLDAEIKEAEADKTYKHSKIQFTPNEDLIDTLKDIDALGIISATGLGTIRNRREIVGATHVKDVNVKAGSDTSGCRISGLVVLPDNRLVVADDFNNKIKTVNIEDGQVTAQLKLTSKPWDITAIRNDKVAVTLRGERKIEIVAMGDKTMSIDRTLNVDGSCWGVDYRNDKLAVSFCGPDKVQILSLQGNVIYTISADKQGTALFNTPTYIVYGQDDTTLYVSNESGNKVVCVKLDGTAVATYTDGELNNPCAPLLDSRGNVYVCAYFSYTVHQISKDCKKLRVLLTKADGLTKPISMCLREEKDLLYVGMSGDNVKVYKTERRSL